MSYGVNSIQIHKKLRLDKRAGSDNWYARLTLPSGKRLIKTTKTDDLEAAKEVALRLYYEVDARIQNKLPATTRKFGDVAKHAINRFKTNCQPLPVSLGTLPNTQSIVWKQKYVRVWASKHTETTYRRSTSG